MLVGKVYSPREWRQSIYSWAPSMYLDFVVKLLKKEKKKLRDEIQKLETKKTQSKKFKLVSNGWSISLRCKKLKTQKIK